MGAEARRRRGRLKIFFGAADGVGKTYAMLLAAKERNRDGGETLVGIVETHGSKEIAELLENLESLPRKIVLQRGLSLQEFDLDQALARRPSLILVDELAHSNAPGARHRKRWQDVKELLDAGIDVYTTLNVQHLESLHEDVGNITGIRGWETVPDTVFDEADEVELVDLPPDALLARLAQGKVCLPRQEERANRHFFRKGNLIALRELALRRTAERVDAEMREYRSDHAIRKVWQAGERILVCVGPDSRAERLVWAGKRLASSLHAAWIVAYVETPKLQRLPPTQRDEVLRVLRLAERLGADTATLSGPDMTEAILDFAREHNTTKLVMGKPGRKGWRRWFLGSVVDSVISRAHDINFYLLGSEPEDASLAEPAAALEQLDSGLAPTADRAGYAGYFWGIVTPHLCTLIAWPLRNHIGSASILMVYLLGVFLLATRYGLGPSLLACLLTAPAFAFFFAPPIFSFAISDTQNLIGLAVMTLVAVITSNLMQNVRSQAKIAAFRERRAAALYGLSKELAGAREEEDIVDIAVRHVQGEFGGSAALLLRNEKGELAYPTAESLPAPLRGIDLRVAQWVFKHGQVAGKGTDTLSEDRAIYIPLCGSQEAIGLLALEPASLRRVFLPEQRRLLETFCNQIVQALERVQSAERAKNASIRAETEALRNSLLGSLSHDLRTPLTNIVGASGALVVNDASLQPEDRRELNRAIHEEALRMSDLTSKLLDMARLEGGEIALDRQWYALEEIVGSALGQLEKPLQDRPVTVRLPEGVPLVWVDAVLLQQVLVNLLDNAVKYTPPGSPIDITAELSPYRLTIAVEDRGPGIPAGMEQKLFDKFYRLQAESAQSGVGLGLAICRAAVQAHGGEMSVESRQGGGAAFSLTLPVQKDPPPMAEEDASEEPP
nr:sensor histidine kinase KdpD [Methylogaea oryzae]